MKPVVLCILDGVGIREESNGNAFKNANKPNFDYLWNNYPHSLLEASGEAVGIPKGQMGNSEVGHTNIGAGRVVYQSLMQINKSIEDKTFFSNEEFIAAIDNCKKNNSNLHICGMVSDGGVHSHINHLIALLKLCKMQNCNRVYIHALLDGRDTSELGNEKYIKQLQGAIDEIGIGKIITIGGRYYLMNRDRDWKLTEYGFNAVINGISDIKANNYQQAFDIEHDSGLTDEFMKPTIIESIPINNNDSLILTNYRSDRMIQLLHSLKQKKFNEFKRKRGYLNIHLVAMTEYEESDDLEEYHIAFKHINLKNTLAEYLDNLGYTQLHLTEFEKSQHVTFYFNGCTDVIYNNQKNKIFDKYPVFTYDMYPPMRSKEITDTLVDSINKYDFIVLNYPNGDSLGHTGIYDKVIEGVEFLDKCLGRIIKETNLNNYILIITADHGNCEIMLEKDGITPDKKHTTSQVPFIICDKQYQLKNKVGKLADIAPTILDIMNTEIPLEMTGESLIK